MRHQMALLNKEELEKLYWDRKLSLETISQKFDVCAKTILNWMHIYGIPTDSKRRRRFPLDKEELHRLYCKDKLSAYEIGKKYGFTEFPVRKKLHFYGIQMRSMNDPARKRGHPKPKLSLTKNKLYDLCWNQHLNSMDLATKFSVSHTTILRLMNRYKIPKHGPHKFSSGNKNIRWTGGYQPYYGLNWRAQRRLARERAKQICEMCKSKITAYSLIVHHIVPFKNCNNYEQANRLKNLICLCRACHMKEEWKNRRFQTK